eukprot:11209230-Prorocentrum_lima.AAC.1
MPHRLPDITLGSGPDTPQAHDVPLTSEATAAGAHLDVEDQFNIVRPMHLENLPGADTPPRSAEDAATQ